MYTYSLLGFHTSLLDLSVGQREAYEVFRQDYKNTPAMEESKAVLKERYERLYRCMSLNIGHSGGEGVAWHSLPM